MAPDAGKLDIGQLDTEQLDTEQLDTGQLDTGQLDTGQLAARRRMHFYARVISIIGSLSAMTIPSHSNPSDRNSVDGVPIDPAVSIGHVHLKVSNLERSLAFYCGILGFQIMERWGDQAAFISAGGYHHHIGLNCWESLGGSPPPRGSTGLYHVAILYPNRKTLADAYRRLRAADIPLTGASDHGVSEALYLHDPDFNGLELYRDRPKEEWPRKADGSLAMFTRRLDLEALLLE